MAIIDRDRTLYVGGIPLQIDETMLTKHFSQYGEVEECTIVLDNDHQPRGYGFVSFIERSVADKVLKENHFIDDTKLIVKPRHEKKQNNQKDQHYHTRKIIVWGLPHDLTEEEFINYFVKFGDIYEPTPHWA